MDQPALLERVANLYRHAQDESGRRQALNFVEEQWHRLADRAPLPEDAETCRLAMLLAAQLREVAMVPLWRSRALTRYVQTGWNEGVASLLLSEALAELARANDGYPDGGYLDAIRPSAEALAILNEMEPFSVEPGSGISTGYGSPTPATVARLMYENRALLLLISGSFEEARKDFLNAVTAAGENPRGRVKSLLGLALADYVQSVHAGNADASAVEATRELAQEAHALGFGDLVSAGRHNLAEMGRGGLHLLPYAIL